MKPLEPDALRQRIDALLLADDGGLLAWPSSRNGQPHRLTYRFESVAAEDFPWTDVAAPVAYPAHQKAAIRDALDRFEAVLNVSFVEADSGGDAMVSFYRSNDLLTQSRLFGTGRADFDMPGPTEPEPVWNGNVVFLDQLDLSNGQNVTLVLHEIGHALGLKHPGNFDIPGFDLPLRPFLPRDENNLKYTVMSYNTGPDTHDAPREPMLYDVAALQHWWGENGDAFAGRTIHRPFETDLQTVIWDSGGRDAIRHSGTLPVTIDLRPGAFSALNGRDITAIAHGALIEGASGARGPDVILGNDQDNRLAGRWGGDTLKGRSGADTVIGGKGADRIFGGTGRDLLDGGAGRDVLTGGAGADVFEFAGRFGQDVILDFTTSENAEHPDTVRFLIGNGEAETFEAFILASVQKRGCVFYDLGDDGANTLKFDNLDLSDLSAGDFEFI